MKNVSKPNDKPGAAEALPREYPRLPCRGCSTSCKHYEICDGRPWRTLTPEILRGK